MKVNRVIVAGVLPLALIAMGCEESHREAPRSPEMIEKPMIASTIASSIPNRPGIDPDAVTFPPTTFSWGEGDEDYQDEDDMWVICEVLEELSERCLEFYD